MKRFHKWSALVLLVITLMVMSACRGKDADYPLSNRITNCDEIVRGIRGGLKGHAASITISFDYGSDIYDELNSVIEEWVTAALEETGDPAEGDYIRYQYGGYEYRTEYTVRDDRFYYTVKIVPDYYDSLTQEQAASEAADAVLKELNIRRNADAYEKIRAVYTYLCENVSYDKINRKYKLYHLKSTAYAALVQNNATCQGYCTAMYRLLRSLGIDCRIITGTAVDTNGKSWLHAWMIAEIDGLYYLLDPTWDAGETEYRYFLAGTGTFSDHTPGERFTERSFLTAYPLSESDYKE